MSNAFDQDDLVLSTLTQDGKRRWLKPKLSRGRMLRRRRIVAYALIAVFVLMPFIQFRGKPLVLLDIVHREFTLFGYTFLPTDTLLLALFLLCTFVSIFLITALFGRLWCGWACPQTVYLEFVYRPLERLFEGTVGRGGQARGDLPPWRQLAKYAAFFLVSLIPAHTFLAYFVGVEQLWDWIGQGPLAHPFAFLVVVLVTAAMFFDFAYFREQLCIIACPYGRFQSALLDRDSMIVSYDHQRGEPRGRVKRGEEPGSKGDCVDCRLCVATCPTGIDIRNGLQMECVNCTQCMDACNTVMAKLGREPDLIRYSSQNVSEGLQPKLFRARVLIYPAILLVLGGTFLTMLVRKPGADLNILRNFGAPFVMRDDGRVANNLLVKINNRGREDRRYTVSVVDDLPVVLEPAEEPLVVAPREPRTMGLLVLTPPDVFVDGKRHVTLRVTDDDTFSREVDFILLGPAGPPAKPPRPAPEEATP